jgi:hypothetical protein
VSLLFLFTTQSTGEILPAQSGGVYATYDDFLHHKLLYEINCNSAKGRLRLNEFFNSPKAYIRINGEKYVFKKNDVYGYLNCRNESYRFFKNEGYRIIDTAGFFLYYQYKTEQAVKGKGAVKTDICYFSTKGDNTILPLTIDNLKKSFPDNHRFHYAIEVMFKSDKDLLAYDNNLKMYKLKYIYHQSCL